MQQPRLPALEIPRPARLTARARARRLLLEQAHQAITTEPAVLDAPPGLPGPSLSSIRGRVSIILGTIVVRLNREGFADSERLYLMRDGLARGQPVGRSDVEWLENAIAVESAGVSA